MPNWCHNTLTVTGPKKDRERFYEENKEGTDERTRLVFDKVIPTPEDLQCDSPAPKDVAKKNKEKYGYEDWYEFRIDKWGCKWNPLVNEVEHGNKSLEYWFDTAWSPPSNWVLAASIMYPTLTFNLQYDEVGNGFKGEFEVKNGEVLIDDCQEVRFDEDGEEIMD